MTAAAGPTTTIEDQVAGLEWADRQLFTKVKLVVTKWVLEGGDDLDELHRQLKRKTGALSPAGYGLLQAWLRSVVRAR